MLCGDFNARTGPMQYSEEYLPWGDNTCDSDIMFNKIRFSKDLCTNAYGKSLIG